MDISGLDVIVVGAGIGGLAAALALRARGAEVRLLEKSPEIREVGAGIQISPNGVAVLKALGLADALDRFGVRGRATVLEDYRRRGEVLRMALDAPGGPGAFYYIHRADMVQMLVDAARAAGVHLRLLQEVETVLPGDRPRLLLANGSEKSADLIIGADGLHSRLRTPLCGQHQPMFTGQVAWRALVPNDGQWPDEAHVQMGPQRHMVTYPLRGGHLMNIVAVQERRLWVAEGWSHTDDPDNLRSAFADFGGRAAALLPQVTEVGLWGLFRHPVAPVWQKGNVALLGDAAHPTLPFLAQGANLALEDAWCLAASLGAAQSLGQGLSAYEAARQPRARKVIEAANTNAWKFHLSLPPVRGLAHLGLTMMGRLAPQRMLAGFDWLYRHDVTA